MLETPRRNWPRVAEGEWGGGLGHACSTGAREPVYISIPSKHLVVQQQKLPQFKISSDFISCLLAML